MKFKKLIKLLFKVTVSAFALHIVFSRVDIYELKGLVIQIRPIWLIIAFIFFNLSKILSSFRLRVYFLQAGTNISESDNLRLYYVGMFYNLFLPGGIGGDGLKIYLLNKSKNGSVKKLIAASLLDRLSGLIALIVLVLLISATFVHHYLDHIPFLNGAIISAVILAFPVFYACIHLFFKSFTQSFIKTNALSLGVQLMQLISAYFILLAIGVEANYVEYLAVFLVSSIVAVLPFTIGGIGARELMFLLASEYFAIEQFQAVTFSILFFIITAISSFAGVFIDPKVKKEASLQTVG